MARVFAIIWALLVLSACTAKKSVDANAPLKVGMELAYPPFEMTDEKGDPSGVSVDIANALGSYLHRSIEIQNIPFDGLIPSLKTGKIDLVISSMTATPERAQSINFSQPYLKTGLALLAGAKSSIQGAGDLDKAGVTVVVKRGTTGQLYAAQHLANAMVLSLDKESSCVLEVAQGKADAFIYDQLSVLKNWKQHKEETRPILNAFQQESWAIGFRKGNEELVQNVNAFIDDFRVKGGFARLGDRWLPEEKKDFTELGIPFVF